MNLNLKTVAHDACQNIEDTARVLREKIAASMTEDENATWNKAVDACAAVLGEMSDTPMAWAKIKATILALKK